jgi:aryl-alcohol dehydrogenase-like predicted oxidoreductase
LFILDFFFIKKGKTFNELLYQLDKEVANLNRQCQTSLEQLNLNKIDLEQLSRESDLIFGEVISVTPRDSPDEPPIQPF